jgi:hypothetical protein
VHIRRKEVFNQVIDLSTLEFQLVDPVLSSLKRLLSMEPTRGLEFTLTICLMSSNIVKE